jgi:hypothetical protein
MPLCFPDPPPIIVDLENDLFFKDTTANEKECLRRVAMLLAMSPNERLRWHESWRRLIREGKADDSGR